MPDTSCPLATETACAASTFVAAGKNVAVYATDRVAAGRTDRCRHVGADVVLTRNDVAQAEHAESFRLRERDGHVPGTARQIPAAQQLHLHAEEALARIRENAAGDGSGAIQADVDARSGLARGHVHRHLRHVVVSLPEAALDIAGRGGCHEVVAGSHARDLESAIGAAPTVDRTGLPSQRLQSSIGHGDDGVHQGGCSPGDVIGAHARARHGLSRRRVDHPAPKHAVVRRGGAGVGAGVGLWAPAPVNITATAITSTAAISHAGDIVRCGRRAPSTR